MLRVLMFAAVLLVAGGPVQAAERVRVGILKLTSSAPIFIGVEKGFNQEQGVDVGLTFFQAAAPIATALAAGQIHVGATGLTAALYNIVLGGEMKATIPRREIVDTSFVESAIKALGE